MVLKLIMLQKKINKEMNFREIIVAMLYVYLKEYICLFIYECMYRWQERTLEIIPESIVLMKWIWPKHKMYFNEPFILKKEYTPIKYNVYVVDQLF